MNASVFTASFTLPPSPKGRDYRRVDMHGEIGKRVLA
jgi:hypothetical protein